MLTELDEKQREDGDGGASRDFVVGARFQSADCKIRYSVTSTTFVLDHDFSTLIKPALKARERVELCVLIITGENQ